MQKEMENRKQLILVSIICLGIFYGMTACSSLKEAEYVPLSRVRGHLLFEGKTLNFTDGFIRLSTEPLEWGKYEIECVLSHDPFTIEQKKTISGGYWVDLNFQSIPFGFPQIKVHEGDKFLSPFTSVMFGKWDTATLPNMEDMEIVIQTGQGGRTARITIDRTTFKALRIDYNPLRVQFSTKGRLGEGETLIEWDICFASTCYGDTWLMYNKWKGR